MRLFDHVRVVVVVVVGGGRGRLPCPPAPSVICKTVLCFLDFWVFRDILWVLGRGGFVAVRIFGGGRDGRGLFLSLGRERLERGG